jgi:ABC-type multidrug transport system ATPase subunit
VTSALPTPAATSPTTTAAIELAGITKNFGPMAALRGITAAFAPQRMYALLGDNGAGKSTLLRVMAGLMQPTRGTISVLGSADLRAIAPRMGYMPHASLLYEEMSAMENLTYFAGLYGIVDPRPCEDAIRIVGLDPALTRRVGAYSQGMRQRLSLARATVANPELLLLDEPFSNVDVPSAVHMVQVLSELRDAGKTIVVITHQPSLLVGVADEFVMMDAGRIVSRSEELPPSRAAEELAALTGRLAARVRPR